MSRPPMHRVCKRDAAASKQLILEAARRRFSRASYGDVGLRAIGIDAGVDPALVGRYFGSKSKLFKEVLADPCGQDAGGSQVNLFDLVDAILTGVGKDCDQRLEQLSIILRSAASEPVSEFTQEAFLHNILRPLASALEGEDAEQRATLALSLVVGVLATEAVLAGELSDDQRRSLAGGYRWLLQAALTRPIKN